MENFWISIEQQEEDFLTQIALTGKIVILFALNRVTFASFSLTAVEVTGLLHDMNGILWL